MKWFGLLAVVVATSQAIYGSDSGSGDQKPNTTAPPVLRTSEPSDSVVVMLPGPPPPTVQTASRSLPSTFVQLAPNPPDPNRPVLHRARRDFPPEFEEDSADFLNQQIGIWQQIDAQELLGEPVRQRPAFNDDQTVNGQILAFPDPTGRYKEVELDFDQETGLLRTLFVYPNSMTWLECRKAFGANVRSTQANKGRTFYSYLDRRLDVLVDSTGKVISLGMY